MTHTEKSRPIGLWIVMLALLVLPNVSCTPTQALRRGAPASPPTPKPAPAAVTVESELNLLVQQFLFSQNEKQTEDLMTQILGHRDTSVENLEHLIRKGGLYPPGPPVGALHESIQVRGYDMRYALYVPENYNSKSEYPLIVCLHGAGFDGSSYLDRWKTRLGEKSLVLCPTIGAGAWWSPQGEALVMAALEAVMSKYRIDPDRIFLTGMSNGGIGTYLVGIFHADRFSAFAPMAGGIPDEVFPYLKNFSTAGVYIIHGEKDQVMPVVMSRKVSDYLNDSAISHVYREHDREHPMAGGHFFPREELPALVKWFEGQRRVSDPAKLLSVRDRVHLNPFYWTEINETEGQVADLQESIFDKASVELVREGIFPSLNAEIEGNRVRVETERVKKLTLFFNRRLIDFSKPVMISVNGERRFEGTLAEDPSFLLKEANRRKDRVSFYSAAVTLDLSPAAPQE